MNRSHFKAIALVRLADSRALLKARRFDAAYYLAGYAVECGLKACIARKFMREDIPDPKDVRSVYTHDLEQLVNRAALERELKAARETDPSFEVLWSTVRDWSETSRYERGRTRRQAENLVNAVADQQHGVLEWIKRYW